MRRHRSRETLARSMAHRGHPSRRPLPARPFPSAAPARPVREPQPELAFFPSHAREYLIRRCMSSGRTGFGQPPADFYEPSPTRLPDPPWVATSPLPPITKWRASNAPVASRGMRAASSSAPCCAINCSASRGRRAATGRSTSVRSSSAISPDTKPNCTLRAPNILRASTSHSTCYPCLWNVIVTVTHVSASKLLPMSLSAQITVTHALDECTRRRSPQQSTLRQNHPADRFVVARCMRGGAPAPSDAK